MRALITIAGALALGATAAFAAEPSPGTAPTAVAPEAGSAVAGSDLLFTPIVPPCRAFAATGGAKALGPAWSSFFIAGEAGFIRQRGAGGGCGVPRSASSVVIALLIPFAAKPDPVGIEARPHEPYAFPLTLNMMPFQTTALTLPIKSDRLQFRTGRNGGRVHMHGDVLGYYAPPLAARLNADGSANSATTRVLTTEKIATGRYRVKFDRDVALCAVTVNPGGGYFYGAGRSIGGAFVETNTWELTSGGVPNPVDVAHQVVASC